MLSDWGGETGSGRVESAAVEGFCSAVISREVGICEGEAIEGRESKGKIFLKDCKEKEKGNRIFSVTISF